MSTTRVWVPPFPVSGPLLPIGGGYSDTYAGFALAVAACARNGRVKVAVLPTAYSTSAVAITDVERVRNLEDAEVRRVEIECACKLAAQPGSDCCVTIAPVFTRADSADPAKIAPLLKELSAVFVLGGDQTVAMAALANTPAEDALVAAHRAGAVIAGTSAGSGMLAADMLAGYQPGFGAADSLAAGAVDVWNAGGHRGLCFGVHGALLDQHFFQRGRLGRLLNAIVTPGAPSLGIGIDAYTGVKIEHGEVGGVFGLYEVAILDAASYGAAASARCAEPEGGGQAPVLSLRNVLVHLLAAGDTSYDLAERRSSLAPVPPVVRRSFAGLSLPQGAGVLLLSGGLGDAGSDHPVLQRFDELAGGQDGCVLVCADGFGSAGEARGAAERLAGKLEARSRVIVACESDLAPADLAGVTAIALVGRDQSQLHVPAWQPWLAGAWRRGMPVLADDAMAAALGEVYSAHGPAPVRGEGAELATQRSFLAGETTLARGAGLLDAAFEPQLLAGNRWGRLFSLAYGRPDLVALGLNRGSAVEIGPDGAWALGQNVTVALDLRAATLTEGASRGMVVANGLLDVFAPGERVLAREARLQWSVPAGAGRAVLAGAARA